MRTYNEFIHLQLERWGGKAGRPRNRYRIRQYRRLRKLKKSGIPIDLPMNGGEVVTKTEEGKATSRAVLIGDAWRD
jgi:hypothetical protein